MNFFNIGTAELLLIFIIALIVVGPRRLPEIGRSIGKIMTDLRKMSQEFTTQMTQELEALPKELEALPKELEALSKELDVLPKELEALPKELDVLPKELEALPKELDVLPKELEALPRENEAKEIAAQNGSEKEEGKEEPLGVRVND
jgi:sec-independent protein translocase protein TatB